jgi:hypothetical protein
MEKTYTHKPIDQFMKNFDVMRKLAAALEDAEQRGALHIFEGLQRGECLIRIEYQGESLRLSNVPQAIKPKAPAIPPEPSGPVESVKKVKPR